MNPEITCAGRLRNMASLYLLRDDKILLLYRQGKSIVKDMWISSAGGHFEPDELNDAKKCVLRELKEELGLEPDQLLNLQLRYITMRRFGDELRQNYYFFATLSSDVPDALPSSEGITQWFPLAQTSHLKMPYTARYVVDHFTSIGQFNSLQYGGIGNDSGITIVEI